MTKLLDLTNNEVRLDDVVAYVYQNKHGKTLTKVGIVVGESNKGLKIMTENGLICVKNVIKLNDNVLDDCAKYVLKESYKEKQSQQTKKTEIKKTRVTKKEIRKRNKATYMSIFKSMFFK